MRKLAHELGVEAMSLYNHVKSKDDLLDGIVETVATEIDLALDEPDWKAATRRRATSAHAVLTRHAWACGLWMSGESFSPERIGFADALLRGLRDGGFSPALTYNGFHLIQGHIIGIAMYGASFQFDPADLKELAAEFLAEFPSGEFPDLAEHIRQHMEESDEHEGAFVFGLELILNGLERLRDAA